MTRDRLADATRALRDTTERAPALPETRSRVMASLRARRARHLSIVRAALPLAAVLVGSIAYAAATGKVPASFRLLGGRADVEERTPSTPAAAAPTPPAPLTPSAPPVDVAPPDPPSPPSPASTAVRAPSAESIAAPPRESVWRSPPVLRSSPSAAPTAANPPSPRAAASARDVEPPAATEPDELALYSEAHRLHFVERNPGAALEAWNRYLRAAPRGRLSVEAHYNRALCLVRLGRGAEARPALEGFARGAYGNYRRAEARALLDAMTPASP